MMGVELLLKSMGFDPAELQSKFGEVIGLMQNEIVKVELSLQRIEMRQLMIMKSMGIDENLPVKNGEDHARIN